MVGQAWAWWTCTVPWQLVSRTNVVCFIPAPSSSTGFVGTTLGCCGAREARGPAMEADWKLTMEHACGAPYMTCTSRGCCCCCCGCGECARSGAAADLSVAVSGNRLYACPGSSRLDAGTFQESSTAGLGETYGVERPESPSSSCGCCSTRFSSATILWRVLCRLLRSARDSWLDVRDCCSSCWRHTSFL
eukprot:3914732-Rhodomonas_salina.2